MDRISAVNTVQVAIIRYLDPGVLLAGMRFLYKVVSSEGADW